MSAPSEEAAASSRHYSEGSSHFSETSSKSSWSVASSTEDSAAAISMESGVSDKQPSALENASCLDSTEQGRALGIDQYEEARAEDGRSSSFGENLTAAALSMTMQAASIATAFRSSIRGIVARVSGPALSTEEEAEDQKSRQSVVDKGRKSSSLQEKAIARRLSSVKKEEDKSELGDNKKVLVS